MLREHVLANACGCGPDPLCLRVKGLILLAVAAVVGKVVGVEGAEFLLAE